MFQLVVIVPLLFGFAAANCVPPQTNFYWTTPCPYGSNVSDVLTVVNLTATQNGVPVDQNGGLNLAVPIDLVIYGNNNYGAVANPLINIGVYHYAGLFSCSWELQPTFGKLNNLDACTIITSDCHFTDPSVTLTTVSIDMKTLLGSLLSATVVGDYYSLAVTLSDGTKPLQCVWSQDKVIAIK